MELTREQIAKEASLHKKFTEQDVNNYWTQRAIRYAEQYEGTFGYMTDMAELVKKGGTLSPRQVRGILNTARREGEQLSTDSVGAVFIDPQGVNPPLPDPVVELTPEIEPIKIDVNFDFGTFDKAVEDTTAKSHESSELRAVTDKINSIKKRVEEISHLNDPIEKLLAESQEEELAVLRDAEQKVKAIREARRNVEAEKINLKSELDKLKEELENQQRLHALTLENIAAQQLFEETKKQFEELRVGKVWDDSILGFQWEDVMFMAAAWLAGKNGVLNANDMGLGKTAETRFWLDIVIPLFIQKYGRHPRIIWLTKKTLRFSSFKELTKWNPDHKPIVLDGNETAREFQTEIAIATNAPVIANYDMLNTTPLLRKTEWDIVIVDEVHKLKGGANPKPTLIWENVKKLIHDKNGNPKPDVFFMPLSGSPIQNHPKEMWAYLHLFDPIRFPNVRHFERNFCFGWGETDEFGNPIVNVDWERIIRAMKDRVIRHSKAECLPDLPDKTREFRYVEMEGKQLSIYQSLRDEFFVWLDKEANKKLNATSILAQLTRLRQAAIMPASMQIKQEDDSVLSVDCYESAKIDEAMEIIEQLTGAGEQVVVFSSQFNPPLKEVQRRVIEELHETCMILSGESSDQFQQIEEAFQNGQIKVLCVNMKTGGEGLNLQKSDNWPGGANHAIFLDLWWNPKFNEQAEDRLHRTGQKDAVTIHIIQTEGSVDQFIAAKLEEKETMIQGIMEDSELRQGSDWADVLRDLL